MAYGDNFFTGVIDENGNIWDMAAGRKRQVIGIDTQKEEDYLKAISEMQETINNYYEKLVELGILKKEKTAEEIAQEAAENQNKLLSEMIATINSLKTEMKELKENGNVGQIDIPSSTCARKKPARNAKSNSGRAEDDLGNAG